MPEETIIRPATLADAEKIFRLIGENSDRLVPRSLGNIIESIDRFLIAVTGGVFSGCAAYQIHPEIGSPESASVEIVSVVVASEFRGKGIGRLLVETLENRISAIAPKEVVVLTFSPEFFRSLGFVEIPKTKIMHKLYTGCINCTKHADPFTCPEIAMVKVRQI